MRRKLERREHIRRLGRGPQAFLQVLLTEFTLTKEADGLLLEVEFSDDDLAVDSSAGKGEFFGVVRRHRGKEREALEAKLQEFETDERLLSYRFDCSGHPLRWSNGGVLPIVRIEGKDYFCLFYRDVFPIGWNIANGASDTVEEMLDPGRVVQREFGEELLICDRAKKLVYLFEPDGGIVPPGFQGPALEAYQKTVRGVRLDEFQRLPLPTRWVDGPDRVRASMGDRTELSGGYFLSVTPQDNAIEVDRFALVNLRGEPVFFDGEYRDGTLFNRVVGLFDVEGVGEALDGDTFRPDKAFFSLEEHGPEKLPELIGAYLSELGPERAASYKRHCKGIGSRLDLCPITRTAINRYFEWADRQQRITAMAVREGRRVDMADVERARVFISFRQEAVQIARWLHDRLEKEGFESFCSAESLQRLGASDYCRVIDRALNAASWLIVVATRAEHFESDWVAYEWRSFMNEIHSGRKPGGRILTFVAGVSVARLPYGLRQVQMITYDPAAPEESLQRLLAFLAEQPPAPA